MPNTPVPCTARLATDEDWPAIWLIVQTVLSAGDTYLLDPSTPEDQAREYWMGPGVRAFVAEHGGQVVGTYAMRANQRGLGAHVANAGFMVAPDQSGKGIGMFLGTHALDEARRAGFRGMQFNAVVSTNRRALALWRRLGFDVVGTVPWAFRHPTRGYVDLHIMYRVL